MPSFLSHQNLTLGLSSKSAHFDVRMTQEQVYYSSGMPNNRVSKKLRGKYFFVYFIR
jgi:hypothetical protein